MFWIIATGCVLLAVLMPIYWKRHPEIKTTPNLKQLLGGWLPS